MEESNDTYAPQSPDLSGYPSSIYPSNNSSAYYNPTPAYQSNTSQPFNYAPQSPFSNQPSSYPSSHSTLRGMTRHGRSDEVDEDDDWVPEPTAKRAGRRSKKPKVEEDYGKSAPGVDEGIEVKTKFPVARIKRIMQADEDVGKVAQVTPTAVCKSSKWKAYANSAILTAIF